MRKPIGICIVTPGSLGSNPRVVKEADTLHAAGFAVTVVSTRTLDIVEPRDDAILRRCAWTSVRLDLRSRAVRAAMRLGFEVTKRFSRFTRSGIGPTDNTWMSWALWLRTRSVVASLYIAHYPAALPAAAESARAHGVRYAYDAEDFHPGDWPETPATAEIRAGVEQIERRHLPGCAYLTAASPEIAKGYVDTYGCEQPTVVLNTFPKEERERDMGQNPLAPSSPSIYWVSQTIGPDRGLEAALRAAALSRFHPHLYLRGAMAQGYSASLDALAERLGIADRVHILPPANPDDMTILASIYDIGLSSETAHTRARDACLPNKIFSYILAGIPVLLSKTVAQTAFASRFDIEDWLYEIDDPEALAGAIDRLLETPQALADAKRKAVTMADETLNWSVDAAQLRSVVESAVAT